MKGLLIFFLFGVCLASWSSVRSGNLAIGFYNYRTEIVSENGTKYVIGSLLEFEEFTRYTKIPSGNYSISVTRIQQTSAITKKFTFEPSMGYTIVVVGKIGSVLTPETILIVTDQPSSRKYVTPGKSQLKIVHTSPDVGGVLNAGFGSITVASHLPYLGISSYLDVGGPGRLRMSITWEDSLQSPLLVPLDVEPSLSYTAYIIGESTWSMKSHKLNILFIPTDTFLA